MKCNNKGMSLVEIIIVIGMMSLLIGVAGYSLSLSSTKHIDECAKKLTNAIQHCRTVTMGKNETTITISYDAAGNVIVSENVTRVDNSGTLVTVSDQTVVGKKGLTITYAVSGIGGGEKSLLTEPLTLKFNRGNGSLQATNGSEITLCTKIVVSKDANSKIIEIVPITGKVTLLD